MYRRMVRTGVTGADWAVGRSLGRTASAVMPWYLPRALR